MAQRDRCCPATSDRDRRFALPTQPPARAAEPPGGARLAAGAAARL